MKWKLGLLCDRTEAEYTAAYKQMSPSRKARVDIQKQKDGKKRTLLGEVLLQELLSEEGITAALCTAENGRPYIDKEALFVSITHCGELVAAAVSDKAVGIDAEIIKPVSRKLIERVAVSSELIYISGGAELPERVLDKETLTRFFEVWTAKEAYFKKEGTGITNLKSVDTLCLQKEIHYINEYVITII